MHRAMSHSALYWAGIPEEVPIYFLSQTYCYTTVIKEVFSFVYVLQKLDYYLREWNLQMARTSVGGTWNQRWYVPDKHNKLPIGQLKWISKRTIPEWFTWYLGNISSRQGKMSWIWTDKHMVQDGFLYYISGKDIKIRLMLYVSRSLRNRILRQSQKFEVYGDM